MKNEKLDQQHKEFFEKAKDVPKAEKKKKHHPAVILVEDNVIHVDFVMRGR